MRQCRQKLRVTLGDFDKKILNETCLRSEERKAADGQVYIKINVARINPKIWDFFPNCGPNKNFFELFYTLSEFLTKFKGPPDLKILTNSLTY